MSNLFSAKRVALAAALAAAFVQSASAASVTTKVVNDGYLTYGLTTSTSLYLLGVSVKGSGKTTQTGGFLTPTTFDFPITSVTKSGNSLTGVKFAGAGLTFSKGTKSDTFNNLSFDFASKSILGFEGSSTKATALFKGTSISGGLSNGSFNYTVSGLALTSTAASAIGAKIGVSSSLLSKVAFGSLAIKAVPEPSTYALIGLGLAGAAVVARRRRAA